jgi:hypothetical protein
MPRDTGAKNIRKEYVKNLLPFPFNLLSKTTGSYRGAAKIENYYEVIYLISSKSI